MIQHVENVLFNGSNPICRPLLPSQHLTNRIVKLDKGKNYFYTAEGLNPSDENSALVHYVQVLFFFMSGERCLNHARTVNVMQEVY